MGNGESWGGEGVPRVKLVNSIGGGDGGGWGTKKNFSGFLSWGGGGLVSFVLLLSESPEGVLLFGAFSFLVRMFLRKVS